MKKNQSSLSATIPSNFLSTLQLRFQKNMHRHKGLKWDEVEKALQASLPKLASLYQMEQTGGEPDVVILGKKSGSIVFFDCSAESPKGRRSICYDKAALDARRENKPSHSALAMATEMGIELLSEQQYRSLQEIEKFDEKTSSWILTPDAIRKRGGALFCDRRYDAVFVYHNGADSYYAARGFRGCLKL
ncbi:MAG: DUF4256 domain-containing protein [Bacteroidetes bacterium]|nr:DUF4256 domain-containing protein [Bacteroidota bacterium]